MNDHSCSAMIEDELCALDAGHPGRHVPDRLILTLLPIDVGFDLRRTRHEVVLHGWDAVRYLAGDRERLVTGSPAEIGRVLRRARYRVALTAARREIG